MLKALDSIECFLTRIIDRPEVAAANSAKTVPIMAFFEGCGNIKTNLSAVGIVHEVYVKTARLCGNKTAIGFPFRAFSALCTLRSA
jgi:hypothetical protein